MVCNDYYPACTHSNWADCKNCKYNGATGCTNKHRYSKMKEIEIPFGAKDSELQEWEYTIPEGMEAEIKDGKIVVREKKPELTPFEQELLVALKKVYYAHCSDEESVDEFLIGTVKQFLDTLLILAKNEICKGCTVGLDQYWKGKEDARKEAEKSYTFHYPTYGPPCHHGGICTNPMRDCINCPNHSSGATTNTTSGTCKKD